MSSYLLCAPPIYGHLAPLVTVGRGLAARGHAITVLTGAKYRDLVTGAGLRFAPLPAEVDYDDADLEELLAPTSAARGVGAIREGMIALFVRVIPAQHRAVLAAIRRLPARQREALVLRYYLDMTESQAADAMRVSRGTVKSTTSRAVAAVARMLREGS